ncbi:MAG: SDR family oxidoreductase [Aggregatilineales bacterium]
MTNIQDKVVIVTGAGSGAGRAIARSFVSSGAKVAFLGRRLNTLEDATRDLATDQVMICTCDVADRNLVNSTVEQIVSNFGHVDILVNNAGTNTDPRSVADTKPDDWDSVLQINLTGTFNMIRAVLPHMREKRSGTIINIASIAGINASKLAGAAYSASKRAMVSLSDSLNDEEWEYGIRASAICPGEINTPLIDKRASPVSEERRAKMLQPEDIANSVLFVANLPAHVIVPLMVVKPLYQVD